jgi:hypothetical protein
MKRISCLVVVVVFLLTGCRGEQPPPQSKASKEQVTTGVIVAIGDSLTAGYGVDINRVIRRCSKKNSAAPGIPTR